MGKTPPKRGRFSTHNLDFYSAIDNPLKTKEKTVYVFSDD